MFQSCSRPAVQQFSRDLGHAEPKYVAHINEVHQKGIPHLIFCGILIGYIILLPPEVIFSSPITILLPPEIRSQTTKEYEKWMDPYVLMTS